MARRGDDGETVACHVEVGARDERELVLAAVARAAVDMAQRERGRRAGGGQPDRRGGGS